MLPQTACGAGIVGQVLTLFFSLVDIGTCLQPHPHCHTLCAPLYSCVPLPPNKTVVVVYICLISIVQVLTGQNGTCDKWEPGTDWNITCGGRLTGTFGRYVCATLCLLRWPPPHCPSPSQSHSPPPRTATWLFPHTRDTARPFDLALPAEHGQAAHWDSQAFSPPPFPSTSSSSFYDCHPHGTHFHTPLLCTLPYHAGHSTLPVTFILYTNSLFLYLLLEDVLFGAHHPPPFACAACLPAACAPPPPLFPLMQRLTWENRSRAANYRHHPTCMAAPISLACPG